MIEYPILDVTKSHERGIRMLNSKVPDEVMNVLEWWMATAGVESQISAMQSMGALAGCPRETWPVATRRGVSLLEGWVDVRIQLQGLKWLVRLYFTSEAHLETVVASISRVQCHLGQVGDWTSESRTSLMPEISEETAAA